MRKNQHKSAKKPSFSLKRIKSNHFILGVDEAGRGAWAGPVVAACVLWSGKNPIKNILRDSKKMNSLNREATYAELLSLAGTGKLAYGIGVMSNDMIDAVGIREANRRAMELALQTMKNEEGRMKNGGIRLLVDGRDNYLFEIPDLPKPEYIVRGDSIVPQIMAASILAKVTRDRLMIEFEKTFPGYGFARHKGYGTKIHQEALKKLGVCEIHRKNYKPVAGII